MQGATPTPEASRPNQAEVSPTTTRINQLQERLGCTEGPFAPVFVLAKNLETHPNARTHKQTISGNELQGADMHRLTELRVQEQVNAVEQEDLPSDLEGLSMEQITKLEGMREQRQQPDFVALMQRAIDLYVQAAQNPEEVLDPVTQEPLCPINAQEDSLLIDISRTRFAVGGSANKTDPTYDAARITTLNEANFYHKGRGKEVSVQLVKDERGWEDLETAIIGSDLGDTITQLGEVMEGIRNQTDQDLDVGLDDNRSSVGWINGKIRDTRPVLGQQEVQTGFD